MKFLYETLFLLFCAAFKYVMSDGCEIVTTDSTYFRITCRIPSDRRSSFFDNFQRNHFQCDLQNAELWIVCGDGALAHFIRNGGHRARILVEKIFSNIEDPHVYLNHLNYISFNLFPTYGTSTVSTTTTTVTTSTTTSSTTTTSSLQQPFVFDKSTIMKAAQINLSKENALPETDDQRVSFEINEPFELKQGLKAEELSHFGPDFKIQMQIKVNALPLQQDANIFSITNITNGSNGFRYPAMFLNHDGSFAIYSSLNHNFNYNFKNYYINISEHRHYNISIEQRQLDLGKRIFQIWIDGEILDSMENFTPLQLDQATLHLSHPSYQPANVEMLFFKVDSSGFSCPSSWINLGKHGCFFFAQGQDSMTWYEADRFCYNLHPNTYLAEIPNQSIQDTLSNLAEDKDDCDWWLGGRDYYQEGIWRWEGSRKPFDYQNWAQFEPNGGVGENCLAMAKRAYLHGKWVDLDCNAKSGTKKRPLCQRF